MVDDTIHINKPINTTRTSLDFVFPEREIPLCHIPDAVLKHPNTLSRKKHLLCQPRVRPKRNVDRHPVSPDFEHSSADLIRELMFDHVRRRIPQLIAIHTLFYRPRSDEPVR